MTFDEHAELIMQFIASHGCHIGGNVSLVYAAVDKLVAVSNQDAINSKALSRIAESR